jgi:hypothetical protein
MPHLRDNPQVRSPYKWKSSSEIALNYLTPSRRKQEQRPLCHQRGSSEIFKACVIDYFNYTRDVRPARHNEISMRHLQEAHTKNAA